MGSNSIVIVGAGLAGLCCARILHRRGRPFTILEAGDRVGGRVRTDEVEGFRLDRGFQVLLTAYPEAEAVLDYERLNLKRFTPGALVRFRGRFHRIADPWRQPFRLLETARAGIGTLADKVRIGLLRSAVRRGSIDDIFAGPDATTRDELRRFGFSDTVIDRFFRPFFGGVFLDPELQTSTRMMRFVFRMFSEGDAALPAAGMGAIPQQIAAGLPPGSVRLNSPVAAIDDRSVQLADGGRIKASKIVVATEENTAARLLPELPEPRPPQTVSCLYFAAEKAPLAEPILVLNGEQSGIVNNLCVPSTVSRQYSPRGESLVSTTVLQRGNRDDVELESDVRSQMAGWFGDQVQGWRLLRVFDIAYGLPDQSPPFPATRRPARVRKNVFLCGDYCENGSIQGAMVSGRTAAEAVLAGAP